MLLILITQSHAIFSMENAKGEEQQPIHYINDLLKKTTIFIDNSNTEKKIYSVSFNFDEKYSGPNTVSTGQYCPISIYNYGKEPLDVRIESTSI